MGELSSSVPYDARMAPQKLVELVEKDNVVGLGKWLAARKRGPQASELLDVLQQASPESTATIVEFALGSPSLAAQLLPRALMQFPGVVPRLLKAGCPIGPLAVEAMSTPEQLSMLLESGLDPANLPAFPSRSPWASWATRDEAFLKALLDAGIHPTGEEVAQLFDKRKEELTPALKERLVSSPEVEPPPLTPRAFSAARQCSPADAAQVLATAGGLLGLRLGMTPDQAAELGFVAGKNDRTTLRFEGEKLSYVQYGYDETLGIDQAICDALTAMHDFPTQEGRSLLWETPAGKITRATQSNPMVTMFTITLEEGAMERGVTPTDLPAFEATLLDYLQDVGPDVLAFAVEVVTVRAAADGLRITYRLSDGNEATLTWASGPLTPDGALTESFASALLAAGAAAQSA